MKKIDKGIYAVGKTSAVLTNESRFVKIKKTQGDTEVSAWGEDNLYPQNFLKKFEKVDAAIGGYEVLTTAHFGNGFKIYEEKQSDAGIDLVERSINSYPDIKTFFRRVKWQQTTAAVISDFEMWRLAFVEYLLAPDKNSIISIKRYPASWCRFSVPDEKKGYVSKVIINSDWENYDQNYNVEIDLIPPDVVADAEEIKEYAKSKKLKSFIIPITSVKLDEKLYPRVGWHSSFNNGWADTVLSVPAFKKWMFINQLHFKYVVYVSDEFMSRKYGRSQWEDFSPEEKEKHRVELVNLIDEHMSGNEASGRSLISPYFRDTNGNLMKGIEIVPVDDKIKDGNFLPDAAAGNSQILFAMGVDPSLIGAGIPGGKNLSGSGSDKREAYTILCAKIPFKRMHILEIFNFIRDYNGWDENLVGNFPNLNLTTLDKNPNGQEEVVN